MLWRDARANTFDDHQLCSLSSCCTCSRASLLWRLNPDAVAFELFGCSADDHVFAIDDNCVAIDHDRATIVGRSGNDVELADPDARSVAERSGAVFDSRATRSTSADIRPANWRSEQFSEWNRTAIARCAPAQRCRKQFV
jgi:hypothetical protein